MVEEPAGIYHYHLLRIALERHQTPPNQLSSKQRVEIEKQAHQTLALEQRVLGSAAAAAVVVDPQRVAEAVATVAQRYSSREELLEDLQRNQLNEALLQQALHRELWFDATLRRVAAGVAAVTEAEISAYYQAHPEKFNPAERRKTYHLLITLNDDFPDNRRPQASARMAQIAAELASDPAGRFGELAGRYSECPSALQGGLLGQVEPGQLYPELDRALFALAEGELSPILESETGLHLLYCAQITPARTLPLEEVRERIRDYLTNQRQREAQRKVFKF